MSDIRKGYTDTDLINELERLHLESGYSELCILRDSETGRSWRLHSTSRATGKRTVREAIVNYLQLKESGE